MMIGIPCAIVLVVLLISVVSSVDPINLKSVYCRDAVALVAAGRYPHLPDKGRGSVSCTVQFLSPDSPMDSYSLALYTDDSCSAVIHTYALTKEDYLSGEVIHTIPPVYYTWYGLVIPFGSPGAVQVSGVGSARIRGTVGATHGPFSDCRPVVWE